jgi:hypothetical protein
VIPFRALAAAQAAYYVATGAWSIAHRPSFERVTGEKHDYWLVRTVGGLAIAIGLPLAAAAARDRREPEIVVLAAGSAMAFLAADLQAARAASPVYLGDAALHVLLLALWMQRSKRMQKGRRARQARARDRVPAFLVERIARS